MKSIITHSPDETEAFAKDLASSLKPGDVIAMRGEMGAGKTAFVRGLARGLDVTGEVASPTYSIVNEYSGKVPLYHFDMYRIFDTLQQGLSSGAAIPLIAAIPILSPVNDPGPPETEKNQYR